MLSGIGVIFDIPSFKIADTVETRTEAFMCNVHLFYCGKAWRFIVDMKKSKEDAILSFTRGK